MNMYTVFDGFVDVNTSSSTTSPFMEDKPSDFIKNIASSVSVSKDQANSAYHDILNYLQQNPDKSGAFLKDIRLRFFTDNCLFRESISFSKLIDTYKPVF